MRKIMLTLEEDEARRRKWRAQYWSNRYHKNIEAGVCPRCRKRPPVPGLKYCEACRERYHESYLRKKQHVMDSGICSRCGKPLSATNSMLCVTCAAAESARHTEAYHRRKNQLKSEQEAK